MPKSRCFFEPLSFSVNLYYPKVRFFFKMYLYGKSHRCAAYECAKSEGHHLCGDCEEFPCDNLHPYADKAGELPQNIKIFNLCLINKMGLEKWAESKASDVRNTYFTKPWTLA